MKFIVKMAETTEDVLFYGMPSADLERYDTLKSIMRFEDILYKRLKAAFPNAYVYFVRTVNEATVHFTNKNGDESLRTGKVLNDMAITADGIAQELFESGEWAVAK